MGDEFPWDDLIDFIEGGQVVPVIGQELVQADIDGARTSLFRQVAQRVAGALKLEVGWRDFSELNDVVGAYLERPGSLPNDLYPHIARALKDLAPAFPPPTALQKLAEIDKLNLFVSVTPDSLMARALDRVRLGGGATREIPFSINQSTSVQAGVQTPPTDNAPVVFSLFGRASSIPDYAIHDEDVLEYIHKLVSGDAAPPMWLIQELRNRPMLMIIGVHLPDWLGRFVLRAATRERLLVTARRYFIARENAPDGQALAEFLRRFGRQTRISVFEGNAAQFVEELHRRWFERFPPRAAELPKDDKALAPDVPRAEVFLSYGRENLAVVERLHDEIAKLGVNVWFDRDELQPGDEWHQRILSAIKYDVRLFIPVFSEQTVERARSKEAYVFSEWRAAIERARNFVGRRFIIPVVIDQPFRGAEAYRYLTAAFPELGEANFGMAPNGVPDTDLAKVLAAEIRDFRRKEVPR